MKPVLDLPPSSACTPVEIWHGCYDHGWKDLIVPDAFTHPAKFARGLISRILSTGLARGWWRKGDLILDPFGGVGCGGILAADHGLSWRGIEIEPKFVGMAVMNFRIHEKEWNALKRPHPRIECGDSRRLDAIRGAAAVVTSPPYGGNRSIEKNSGSIDFAANFETYRKSGGRSTYESYCKTQQRHSGGYGSAAGQIGDMPLGAFNGVVTSPPWEDMEGAMNSRKFKDPEKVAKDLARRDGFGGRHKSSAKARMAQLARQEDVTYGRSDGQIGNVTGDTYWKAMSTVYRGCFHALAPGGVIAVVMKDYVKAGKLVPLTDQTQRLLEAIGFVPVQRFRAALVKVRKTSGLYGDEVKKVERKSFFRRLAESKGSPAIDFEEVIVARKPAGGAA